MRNDLISRSALLQHLRGNVLVDVTPNLEEAVEEEPTAYDVDNVVEQLEEYIRESNNIDYNRAMCEAIEIVKLGMKEWEWKCLHRSGRRWSA